MLLALFSGIYIFFRLPYDLVKNTIGGAERNAAQPTPFDMGRPQDQQLADHNNRLLALESHNEDSKKSDDKGDEDDDDDDDDNKRPLNPPFRPSAPPPPPRPALRSPPPSYPNSALSTDEYETTSESAPITRRRSIHGNRTATATVRFSDNLEQAAHDPAYAVIVPHLNVDGGSYSPLHALSKSSVTPVNYPDHERTSPHFTQAWIAHPHGGRPRITDITPTPIGRRQRVRHVPDVTRQAQLRQGHGPRYPTEAEMERLAMAMNGDSGRSSSESPPPMDVRNSRPSTSTRALDEPSTSGTSKRLCTNPAAAATVTSFKGKSSAAAAPKGKSPAKPPTASNAASSSSSSNLIPRTAEDEEAIAKIDINPASKP